MLTADQQLSVQAYIGHVTSVHAFLNEQSDLSPRNVKVNAALHAFVHDTMKARSQEEVAAILNMPTIRQVAPGLRRLLGRAEHEMEFYCASAMIGGEMGAEGRFSSYGNFIYRSNYEALVAAELQAMKWHIEPLAIEFGRESVAFVGSGPLPISAIMFHMQTGSQVICIDSDEKACSLGRQLVLYLAANEPGCEDLDKAIQFSHARGEDYDYATHPVVFIASLVEAKEPVVMRIMETSQVAATTIVRGAEGLSTLLYDPEDRMAAQEEYNAYLTGKTRPSPDAINRSFIYRFPVAGPARGRASMKCACQASS
jgi:hypothetical protein